MKTRSGLLLLTVLVLLLRLPFVDQSVGGDDVYYLAAAYHGLTDPLHPNHTSYVFEGRDVTFQGYPHPPGNAAFLMILLAVFGDVREIPFHVAYLLFSLAAVYGMYALARRFSPHPLWATLLFLAVPAFVVNGNSFESDVPLLAFWMTGAAAFVYAVDRDSKRLLALAAACLAATGMIAMQALLFTPILLAYLFIVRKKRPAYLIVAAIPILVLIGWQLFERITSGQFPAAVSAAYMAGDGFARVAVKLRNALALSIHTGFMIFPILLPFAVRETWRRRNDPATRFLLAWIILFLGGAWVIFYAGSARYLLPLAAPLAILASLAPVRWVRVAFALQLALSVSLAAVNEQQWNSYRAFAASLREQTLHQRVWVDAEWGLRHYFEADGALPMHRDQWIPPGDIVVESELAFPAPIPHGGSSLVPIADMTIDPWLPLRLIGIDAQSGYSTTSKGLLPYDVRGGVIDRVHAFALRQRDPERSVLPMGSPDAESQIVSGIYPAEGAPWRWMSGDATMLLKSPRRPATLQLQLYIADAAPARTVRLSIAGGPSTTQTFPGPGSYSMNLPVDTTNMSPVAVTIHVDRTFSTAADSRKLGIILNEIGLQ